MYHEFIGGGDLHAKEAFVYAAAVPNNNKLNYKFPIYHTTFLVCCIKEELRQESRKSA